MAEALVRQQQLVSLPKRPRHYDHDEDVNDIIVEILSRLPVKSLLRFRSVCKSWRALISDSYFVKKHLGHAVTDTSNSSRLLHLLYTSPRIVDLQGLEDHDHIRQRDAFADDILDRSQILGSCNGLMCLQATNGLYCDDIFLWNPSTRVAKKVPEHNFTKGSISIHGFGYDSTTDDYKLILGARNKVAKKTKIAIFTVKTGSWRTVQDFEFVHYLNGQGCFVNGALHWLDSMYKSTSIVSFDLAEEKCDTLCRIEYGPMFRMGIGTIRNCLCYYTYSNIRSMPMTIWMMNEYGINKPWTKLMNIPTNIIPYKISLRPKHVVENGEVLMILDGKDFVIYNPKENKYRTVFQSPTILHSAAVVVYLDTLVSPEFGS